jgi:hypothetical protein
MSTFKHPSPELPAFAPFELTLPDGWRADEAPDTLGVMVDPAATDFRVNLLVGVDRVAIELDLATAAQSTLAEASAYAVFKIEREHTDEIGGEVAAIRFQSFAVEGAPDRLLQMQVLLFNPPDGRRKTKDLFHIDGTCLERDAEMYAPIFLAAARSFRFL